MVAALGDRGMLRLMDFYKCYRLDRLAIAQQISQDSRYLTL
jgi:hypothetical protein